MPKNNPVKLPVKVETSGLERLGTPESFIISDNTEASFPTIATPSLSNTMQTDANVFLYDATAIAAIEDGNNTAQDVPATPTSFEELVAMLDIPGFTTTTEDDHTQCATLDPGTKWPI
ncbi:Hypp7095 [Branchiostoma lanceolatum]|uniref:Hypp7095 protein n=1 Tax=Branchiostoma lanceolatum TaxID=7740 RepID=A0A8K0E7C3_BRALA|nr:Hypp7095 [Branchiostoma lanceolatum]